MDGIDAVYREVSLQEKVPYVQMNERIDANLTTLMDHIHPTREGNEEIGKALRDAVEKSFLEYQQGIK